MSGLSKLEWTRPRGLPHGLSGACALVVGGCLLGCALVGDLGPFVGAAPALHAYVVAAGANAVAGYQMAGRAPLVFQRLFRFTAAFVRLAVFVLVLVLVLVIVAIYVHHKRLRDWKRLADACAFDHQIVELLFLAESLHRLQQVPPQRTANAAVVQLDHLSLLLDKL